MLTALRPVCHVLIQVHITQPNEAMFDGSCLAAASGWLHARQKPVLNKVASQLCFLQCVLQVICMFTLVNGAIVGTNLRIHVSPWAMGDT